MLAAVALLAVGAGVGLHADEVRGLSVAEAGELISSLASAIEARSGRTVVIDRPPAKWKCTKADRCADEIRARTQSSDIVFLRVLGVPTRVRVFAALDSSAQPAAEIDLPRARDAWSEPIQQLVAGLFPAKPAPPVKTEPPPQLAAAEPAPQPHAPELVPRAEVSPASASQTESGARWVPWALIGAGAAAGVAGIGFGLSSRGARSSAANEPHSSAELADLEDRAIGHGIAADVLFGAALAGIGSGVVWLIVRD